MKFKFEKSDLILLLTALAGVVVFALFYPKIYPEAAVNMKCDKDEIVRIATDFVEEIGIDHSGYSTFVDLKYNKEQLNYFNRSLGPLHVNEVIRKYNFVYYWEVKWSSLNLGSINLMGGDEEVRVRRAAQIIQGNLLVLLDLNGRPTGLRRKIEVGDSSRTGLRGGLSTTEEDRTIAEKFFNRIVRKYEGTWLFERSEENRIGRGIERNFYWRRKELTAGGIDRFRITVWNGSIVRFKRLYSIPDRYALQSRRIEWRSLPSLIIFMIFAIFVLVNFIKRLRSDRIDLKNGIAWGIASLVGYSIREFTAIYSSTGEMIWVAVLTFIFVAPFIGGAVWIIYSLGESLNREVWPDKLAVIDRLKMRHFLFPDFGISLLRGAAISFVVMGFITTVIFCFVRLFNGSVPIDDSTLNFFSSNWPSLYGFSRSLVSSIPIVVTYCLFFLTLLKKRFNHTIPILMIVFVIWSFVNFPSLKLTPLSLQMVASGILGLLFTLLYIKYEFLSVCIGAMGVPMLFYGAASLYSGVFPLHGFILIGIFLLSIILGLFAVMGREISDEVVPYVPDYLQRIYERERIQRELEIARNVQLSFLPRKKPEVNGLDIATLCIPAKEVGGDYYDFLEIDNDRLGIVIGDVSGKGISAAFYMTLTKGFLKAQVRQLSNPKDILINMNELFYENSERGFFISLIYGIFDLKRGQLTFARAGHNPLIFKCSGKEVAEEINPRGIAIGLESGKIFSDTIEERSVKFKKGDLFLFYTDGLNEARNWEEEEFGEERLMDMVESSESLSAEEIIKNLRNSIEQFSNNMQQHDDMTAVVVKIV